MADKFIPFILLPVIGFGVWNYLKKKNRLNELTKKTLLIAMCAFFITELGRSFYRPYIYHNNIDDFFIANTLGNSFGTMTAIFMILTLSGSGTSKDRKILFIIIIGLIFYEFLNLTGKHSIDLNDIFATLLFGFISALIYFIILSKYGDKMNE